jgi:hypothetical protein
MQPRRRPIPLIAKKKAITVLEICIPVTLFRLGCEQPDPLGTVRKTQKTLPVIVMMDLQIIPIIHTTTLQVPICDLKSQRMD